MDGWTPPDGVLTERIHIWCKPGLGALRDQCFHCRHHVTMVCLGNQNQDMMFTQTNQPYKGIFQRVHVKTVNDTQFLAGTFFFPRAFEQVQL